MRDRGSRGLDCIRVDPPLRGKSKFHRSRRFLDQREVVAVRFEVLSTSGQFFEIAAWDDYIRQKNPYSYWSLPRFPIAMRRGARARGSAIVALRDGKHASSQSSEQKKHLRYRAKIRPTRDLYSGKISVFLFFLGVSVTTCTTSRSKTWSSRPRWLARVEVRCLDCG